MVFIVTWIIYLENFIGLTDSWAKYCSGWWACSDGEDRRLEAAEMRVLRPSLDNSTTKELNTEICEKLKVSNTIERITNYI
jgi:hypothetical protein